MKNRNRFTENSENRKKYVRDFLVLCLSVILLLSAVGCKPSPALRDYVYDNRVSRIHPSETKELENEPDHTEPDGQIPPEQYDQTGKERNRERQDPLLADEDHPANAEGHASQPEYVPNAQSRLQGSSLQEVAGSGGNGFAASEGSENERSIDNNTGSSPGTGSESGESDQPEDVETGREMVDDSGTETEVPEQVESLAATGNAAVLIEMLGGGSILRYSSENLKEGLSGRIFDTKDTQVLWQGSGNTPLSEQDFQSLLESAPAVCLEISGQTSFTEEQVRNMQDAGIQYVVIPAITGLSSACQAVEQTAKIIGSSEAEERSKEFLQFCSKIESYVSGKTSAYSPDGINFEDGSSAYSLSETDGVLALYISAWDSSAHYLLHNESTALEGNGVAVVQTGYLRHPVTAFLSMAGVANASSLSENNYSLSSGSIKIRYVNPVVNSLYNLNISGGTTGAGYTKEYVYTSTSLGNLGEDRYKHIIVPDEPVRQAILSDDLWKSWPYQKSSGGHNEGYGFTDRKGNLVETTIHGDYDIAVMPQGAADWNSGCIESVMIPLWALWKIRGLADRAVVVDYLQEFYQSFYKYTLSESEIHQILTE